jgi:hypothetical protein
MRQVDWSRPKAVLLQYSSLAHLAASRAQHLEEEGTNHMMLRLASLQRRSPMSVVLTEDHTQVLSCASVAGILSGSQSFEGKHLRPHIASKTF